MTVRHQHIRRELLTQQGIGVFIGFEGAVVDRDAGFRGELGDQIGMDIVVPVGDHQSRGGSGQRSEEQRDQQSEAPLERAWRMNTCSQHRRSLLSGQEGRRSRPERGD
ncbi:hypothetical protein D3C77_618350 [compost metagenome]